MKQTRLITALLCVGLSQVGCTTYQRINDQHDGAAGLYTETSSQALTQEMSARSIIHMSSTPWVSKRPIVREVVKARMPSELDCKVSFRLTTAMPLHEFAQAMTDQCGLPVKITADVWSAFGERQTGAASAPMTPTPMLALPPMPSPIPPGGVGTQTMSVLAQPLSNAYVPANNPGMYVNSVSWIDRPISGLMDVITARLGLSWRYSDGAIEVHYLDTRTFQILAIASTNAITSTVATSTSLSSTAGGGSGTGSGSSGASPNATTSGESNQKTEVSITNSLVDDIKRTVETMLTPGVGKVALSMSTGSVTVTDTPIALQRISKVLEAANENMTRQVMLYVTVASVTLNDADSLGINWNAVFSSLSGRYGLSLTNSFSPLTGSATAGFGILDSATGRAAQFRGSEAVLSALSQQGTVSIQKQRNVTTLNLQPSPIQMTREQQYICGRTAASTANVGITSGVQLCNITTGFSMDMLPHIVDPSSLLLQFGMNMSPPAVIQTIEGTEDEPIQRAIVDRQVFQQRVRMKTGQTLVLSDFQENERNTTKQGLGDLSAWALTGGGTRTGKRQVVVIVITPVIDGDTMNTAQASY